MHTRSCAFVIVWMAAGLTLGGCAAPRASLSDLPEREWVGHYIGGPGESWFRPCGAAPADPSWWVTLTGRSVEQLDPSRAADPIVPGQRYFVRWRAAITTEGQVGPHGPGVPALLVRELLERRPAADTDCAETKEAP